jgi:protocatechuate 3,4-dioxygenase, beta subunit
MTAVSTRLYPPYVATQKRAPLRPLIPLPQTPSELTGPSFGPDDIAPGEEDLTRQHHGEPVGQRILLTGRVLDRGRPVPGTLVELWQANAAGRYRHPRDQYQAPLDPNFTGAGRTLTDREGRYRFVTIVPGPYPWRNHFNAWRPAHIHFSVFGPSFATRLVTQMYFEGDPLLAIDPIFNSIADSAGRDAMIAHLDWETSEEYHALGYRFDVDVTDASQTVGPYFSIGLARGYRDALGGDLTVSGRLLDGDGRPVSDGVLEIWQADARGVYGPPFRGFGRVPTDADGGFRFTTLEPGAVPGPDGRPQAPHLMISVLGRGILRRLATRMYFPDAAANAADPVLETVPPDRRHTLVARPGLAWNVVLQGEDESVFFDI